MFILVTICCVLRHVHTTCKLTRTIKPHSPPTGWWYKMHRMIQTSGLLLATAGLVLAVSSVGGSHGEHFGGWVHTHTFT